MSRRGYSAEYEAKQELVRVYGRECVVKVAVSQSAPDFLVLDDGCVVGVEVKARNTPFVYLNRHDREQFERFVVWSGKTRVPVYYWIRLTDNKRHSWLRLSIDDFGRRYIKQEQEVD